MNFASDLALTKQSSSLGHRAFTAPEVIQIQDRQFPAEKPVQAKPIYVVKQKLQEEVPINVNQVVVNVNLNEVVAQTCENPDDKDIENGKATWVDGTKYEGAWQDYKPSGKGKMTFANGATYEGDWLNGQMHGQGTLKIPQGTEYVGEFEHGEKNGKGTMKISKTEHYRGEFKDGKYHGKGFYKYAKDFHTYEGDFVKNFKHGEGVESWGKGGVRKYVGTFHTNAFHGEGTYHYASGRMYKGQWKNGRQDGKGQMQDQQGDIFRKGTWKYGCFVVENAENVENVKVVMNAIKEHFKRYLEAYPTTLHSRNIDHQRMPLDDRRIGFVCKQVENLHSKEDLKLHSMVHQLMEHSKGKYNEEDIDEMLFKKDQKGKSGLTALGRAVEAAFLDKECQNDQLKLEMRRELSQCEVDLSVHDLHAFHELHEKIKPDLSDDERADLIFKFLLQAKEDDTIVMIKQKNVLSRALSHIFKSNWANHLPEDKRKDLMCDKNEPHPQNVEKLQSFLLQDILHMHGHHPTMTDENHAEIMITTLQRIDSKKEESPQQPTTKEDSTLENLFEACKQGLKSLFN